MSPWSGDMSSFGKLGGIVLVLNFPAWDLHTGRVSGSAQSPEKPAR